MGPALLAQAGWRAEEVFLAWLLSLPEETDPSLAAITALRRNSHPASAGEPARLRALLEETTGWTGPALTALARGSRTRRRS
jgi:hypothetical protein